MWTVHFKWQNDTSGRRTGDKVGGPYKSIQRARNVLDKKDNEYGAYVHTIRPVENVKAQAQHLNAQANLLEQERLSAKAAHLNQIGQEASKLENKTPMTSQSLGLLGAGKPFGQ